MWLSAKEYGELCHAVWNKHANKIPNQGYILYKDSFYRYTFNADMRIYCEWKMQIEGNEDLIDFAIRRLEGEKL